MHVTDDGLVLSPLSGGSGKAYKGTYPDGDMVFVKMDTTPILAALAESHIAPKLLWSKRTLTGSMMSAQEWLDGHILERTEMTGQQVMGILKNLHFSLLFANQLRKLNYEEQTPADLIKQWWNEAVVQVRENTYLQSVASELLANPPRFNPEEATIVHGDIHHTNWIATKSGLIYLTDWDNVHLTDRMFDVAFLLSHYIPRPKWQEWLTQYGYKYNKTVLDKLEWYAQLAYLYQINKCFEANNIEKVNREIYALRCFRDLRGRYES